MRVLFLLGLGALGALAWWASAAGDEHTAPSGKPWPPALTTTRVNRAVAYAVATEHDSRALRAFAAQVEPYDAHGADTLRARALTLDAGIVSTEDLYRPTARGLGTGATGGGVQAATAVAPGFSQHIARGIAS